MNVNFRTGCVFVVWLWVAAGLLAERAGAAEAKTEPHFAKFGTNKLHYFTGGQGTNTIVFIHGWACNAGFWREQVPVFADQAKLVMIDLPGHGESDKPQADYTMDYFADAEIGRAHV